MRVDWLNKQNTKLAYFIKSPQFSNIHFWRFEDDNNLLHMDLSEENSDADYWKTQLKEKSDWRDEFFNQFKELLPPKRNVGP